MRNAARAAVIAIGALYAWQWRFYVNPDAVAYFDVADTLLARGWFAAIHTHRSPLYPLLLAAANHVPPYWESTVAHGVTFLMYCAAFAALEFLLAQLHNAMLVPLAYALFLWACNFTSEAGPAVLTPDLLVAAAIFLGSALVVRIANGRRDWPTYAFLGATLGLGYLSKEAMLPIGALLLVTAAIAGGRRVVASAALFAAIACFYIVPLSMKLHRFSTGETSRYNLIMWVAASGRPIHARPVLFRAPLIVGYPDAAGRGTYAVIDDLRYWFEGMQPRFDARAELRRIGSSLGEYFRILRSPLHLALLILFAWILFRNRRWRHVWVLTLPSLATMAMYGLVLVQPRYIAPSMTVLWIGLFAGFGEEALRRAARPLWIAGAAVLLALVANGQARTEWQTIRQRPIPENWLVAERLRHLGIHPGDHVAVVNPPYMSYWARLAKVRIAAEVMEPNRFWSASEATQEAAVAALQRYGIRAIVAEDAPDNDAPCFESVDDTSYLVCVPASSDSVALSLAADDRSSKLAQRSCVIVAARSH